MNLISNLKEMSFLIYGLGLTGQSVAKFLEEIIFLILKYGMIKIKPYTKKKIN